MALTSTELTVSNLICSIFNAPAGKQHLQVFTAQIEAGKSIDVLAEELTATVEFNSLYPRTLSTTEFATAWVANLLGQTVSNSSDFQFAVDYIVGLIDVADISRAGAIQAGTALLVSLDNNDPIWGAASTQLDNKFISAANYSASQSSLSLEALQGVISGVTEDHSTIAMNDGADTITVTDILNDLVFDTGTGADTVTIQGAQGGAVICTGSGSDTVTLGNLAVSALYTGAENDTLTITTVEGSKVDAGTGNNTVSMTEVEGSSILAGSGNDTIHLYGTVTDFILNAGHGNNTVTVANARGISTVNTGDNADTVNITNMANDVKIDTGAGTDTLLLSFVEDGYKGSVNLGQGIDALTMTLASAALHTDVTFDGGNGSDVLTLAGVTATDWNSGLYNYFFNFETVNVNGVSVVTNLNFRDPPTYPDIAVESALDMHDCSIGFTGLIGPQ